MEETTRAARADLAFMRAVAEDRGAPPALLGWHLLAIGLCFGPNFVLIWAIVEGLAPWPKALMKLTWAPGAALYLAAVLAPTVRGLGRPLGPTAKLYFAAWAAIGLMIVPLVAVISIGQTVTGLDYSRLWPALSFVLYGGAWASLATQKKAPWHGLVALGCFATGALAAALMTASESWLVMAAGLAAFVAAPGGAILWLARKT